MLSHMRFKRALGEGFPNGLKNFAFAPATPHPEEDRPLAAVAWYKRPSVVANGIHDVDKIEPPIKRRKRSEEDEERRKETKRSRKVERRLDEEVQRKRKEEEERKREQGEKEAEKQKRDAEERLKKEVERKRNVQIRRKREEKEEEERLARLEELKKKKVEEQPNSRVEELKKKRAEEERKSKVEELKKKRAEEERKAKLEEERKAKLEEDRKAKLEEERKARLEERKAKLEEERKAKLEEERKAKLEEERKAKKLEEERKKKEGEETKKRAESRGKRRFERALTQISLILDDLNTVPELSSSVAIEECAASRKEWPQCTAESSFLFRYVRRDSVRTNSDRRPSRPAVVAGDAPGPSSASGVSVEASVDIDEQPSSSEPESPLPRKIAPSVPGETPHLVLDNFIEMDELEDEKDCFIVNISKPSADGGSLLQVKREPDPAPPVSVAVPAAPPVSVAAPAAPVSVAAPAAPPSSAGFPAASAAASGAPLQVPVFAPPINPVHLATLLSNPSVTVLSHPPNVMLQPQSSTAQFSQQTQWQQGQPGQPDQWNPAQGALPPGQPSQPTGGVAGAVPPSSHWFHNQQNQWRFHQPATDFAFRSENLSVVVPYFLLKLFDRYWVIRQSFQHAMMLLVSAQPDYSYDDSDVFQVFPMINTSETSVTCHTCLAKLDPRKEIDVTNHLAAHVEDKVYHCTKSGCTIGVRAALHLLDLCCHVNMHCESPAEDPPQTSVLYHVGDRLVLEVILQRSLLSFLARMATRHAMRVSSMNLPALNSSALDLVTLGSIKCNQMLACVCMECNSLFFDIFSSKGQAIIENHYNHTLVPISASICDKSNICDFCGVKSRTLREMANHVIQEHVPQMRCMMLCAKTHVKHPEFTSITQALHHYEKEHCSNLTDPGTVASARLVVDFLTVEINVPGKKTFLQLLLNVNFLKTFIDNYYKRKVC